MEITFKITEEAAALYIAARIKGDSNMTDAEFIVACMVSDITSIVETQQVEQVCKDAIEAIEPITVEIKKIK